MSAERLFVYGSLRSDAPRDQRVANLAFASLERGAELEGKGSVAGDLYAVSWFPGFVDTRRGKVYGQVWLIRNPRIWPRLDEYEGGDFLRQPHRVDMDDGRRVTAWLYMYRKSVEGVPLISSGDYLDWVRTSS